MTKFGIHWFRRDLRIPGNPALQYNWKQSNGKVLGLFIFDKKFLSRPDFSHNRFAFFINTLEKLKYDLKAMGSDLLVLDSTALEGFQTLLKKLNQNKKIQLETITYNRDYEPFARNRDQEVTQYLKSQSLHVHNFRDHLIIEPHELLKSDGTPYKVYTPFFNKWFELLQKEEFSSRIELQKTSIQNFLKRSDQKKFDLTWPQLQLNLVDQLDVYKVENFKKVTIPIPDCGFERALDQVELFRQSLNHYTQNRDIPSLDGTSRLSHFFKNGSLTTSQVCAQLNLHKHAPTQYLKEIAWREFYYHILYHFDYVENEAFIPKYKKIKWSNNLDFFEKWKNGQTGYPIVDAGMRQLKQTGWMHNRVRMIVASFLVKDLLIDWRWGEKYFMEQLIDGDLAANNGGWQWCASTGCDPQPYFRIFNPTSQGEKFDPQGEYIKTYIPELFDVPEKYIHEPHTYFNKFNKKTNYPQPIVQHELQRKLALELYKSC